MTLIKYNPRNQMDTLFDRMTRDLWPTFGRVLEEATEDEALRLPRTNIRETDKEYLFEMEMPGLTRKDVEVAIEGDHLTVRGERTVEHKSEKGNELIRCEIRSAKFERSFNLGKDIDADSIKAKMEDGVLKLTLPKHPERLGRKIDVS